MGFSLLVKPEVLCFTPVADQLHRVADDVPQGLGVAPGQRERRGAVERDVQPPACAVPHLGKKTPKCQISWGTVTVEVIKEQ